MTKNHGSQPLRSFSSDWSCANFSCHFGQVAVADAHWFSLLYWILLLF